MNSARSSLPVMSLPTHSLSSLFNPVSKLSERIILIPPPAVGGNIKFERLPGQVEIYFSKVSWSTVEIIAREWLGNRGTNDEDQATVEGGTVAAVCVKSRRYERKGVGRREMEGDGGR